MAGGSRNGSGRRRVEIDLAELEKLCVLQCTDEEIASWFGVSSRTIERRRKRPEVRDIMERGKAKGRVSLRRSLWRLANAGNPAANIFLAKNLLGYRDVSRDEPRDDVPFTIQVQYVDAILARARNLNGRHDQQRPLDSSSGTEETPAALGSETVHAASDKALRPS